MYTHVSYKQTRIWVYIQIKLPSSDTLYTDNDDGALLSTWMVSHPKTKDMWYDKLNKSAKGSGLLENLNLASDEYSEEECLAMRKSSTSNLSCCSTRS